MREPAIRRALSTAVALFSIGLSWAVVHYVATRGGDGAGRELRQPVSSLHREMVELQVAIHDAVEHTPRPIPVRICRSLASRRVTLDSAEGTALADVLESLAAQVGSRLETASLPGEPVLPTLPCAGDGGDYLVIGAAQ